jgi:hypothetical protein
MQITLKLTPTQAALLRALAPRGAAVRSENRLEDTAMRILTDGMKREGRQRRIGWDQVGATALVEAAARKDAR